MRAQARAHDQTHKPDLEAVAGVEEIARALGDDEHAGAAVAGVRPEDLDIPLQRDVPFALGRLGCAAPQQVRRYRMETSTHPCSTLRKEITADGLRASTCYSAPCARGLFLLTCPACVQSMSVSACGRARDPSRSRHAGRAVARVSGGGTRKSGADGATGATSAPRPRAAASPAQRP